MRRIAITVAMLVVLLMTYANFKTIEQNDYAIDKLNYKISKLVETDEVVVNALKDNAVNDKLVRGAVGNILYNMRGLNISVLDSIGVICNENRDGACVAIGPNLILTAGHCIDISNTWIEINGRTYEIINKWRSEKYDVGFARIKGRVHSLKLGVTPQVLDTVWLIGSPYSKIFRETITKGIISHLNRDLYDWKDLIQTDAEGAPGSSGGPLLSNNGEILGICVTGVNPGGGVILCEPVSHIIEALERCDI